MHCEKTTTLKQLRKDIEVNRGHQLSISNLPILDLTKGDKVVLEPWDIEEFLNELVKFSDYGKLSWDGFRCDIYFKNGKRAITIYSNGF